MIAVCTTCGKMFETTEEEACTPGVECPSCYVRYKPVEPEPWMDDPAARRDVLSGYSKAHRSRALDKLAADVAKSKG